MNKWLARTALDIVGEGTFLPPYFQLASHALALVAFDFDFGALDSKDNELGKAYENMLYVSCSLSLHIVHLLTSL